MSTGRSGALELCPEFLLKFHCLESFHVEVFLFSELVGVFQGPKGANLGVFLFALELEVHCPEGFRLARQS